MSLPLFCFQGEWVWVDSKIGVPIGARVKETPSGQRLLVDDEGNVRNHWWREEGKKIKNVSIWHCACFLSMFPQERRLSLEEEASLKIMHPTSVEGVDDMIKLGDMTEAALLRNLLLRHKQGHIYVSHTLTQEKNTVEDFPFCFQKTCYFTHQFVHVEPSIKGFYRKISRITAWVMKLYEYSSS